MNLDVQSDVAVAGMLQRTWPRTKAGTRKDQHRREGAIAFGFRQPAVNAPTVGPCKADFTGFDFLVSVSRRVVIGRQRRMLNIIGIDFLAPECLHFIFHKDIQRNLCVFRNGGLPKFLEISGTSVPDGEGFRFPSKNTDAVDGLAGAIVELDFEIIKARLKMGGRKFDFEAVGWERFRFSFKEWFGDHVPV